MGKTTHTHHHKSQSKQNQKHSSSTSSSKKQQSKSPTLKQQIVWIINILIAVAITYLCLGYLCRNQYITKFIHRAANTQQIIQQFVIVQVLVIFVHVFLYDWMQIVFDFTQHDIMRAHKNCINHAILWTIIFWGPIFANLKGIQSNGIFAGLVDVYLVGRLLFSFGYIVGAAAGYQSFRSVGMGLIFGACLLVIGEATGHSMIKYFQ